MDKNAIPLSLVESYPNDATEVLNWFASDKQIKEWGGPAMCFPISEIDFISRLNLNGLDSFKVVAAHAPNKILAFGQFYVRLGRHHLGRLAVSPSSRGHGLGKFLVKALIDKAHESQTAQGESLFVMKDNTVAIGLYQSLGFKFADYPDTLPNGLDTYLYMIRDISR